MAPFQQDKEKRKQNTERLWGTPNESTSLKMSFPGAHSTNRCPCPTGKKAKKLELSNFDGKERQGRSRLGML